MINQTVFKHVKKYCESKNWGTTEEDIIETIIESNHIWKDEEERHRWWNEYTYVIKIDGMLIGFRNAETTGDMTAKEAGYEFDSNSICEYESKEITTTVYQAKE
jgi:hypothetical protein